MDKIGRIYASKGLKEYIEETGASRETLTECLDVVPFIHRNGLAQFIRVIETVFEAEGATPEAIQRRFSALLKPESETITGVVESSYDSNQFSKNVNERQKESAPAKPEITNAEHQVVGGVSGNTARKAKSTALGS